VNVPADKLRIGGFVPFTATDYPDHLAAVVFCQGCPWRCGYCHNPHLIPARGKAIHDWPAIAAFLGTRRGLLDAVVFSGGEPTLHDALPAAMLEVRDMGFKVGLHTAGIYPRKLAAALPFADWVGMDVKAPFESYERVTGVAGSGASACESAKLVVASGVAHEFRTTVDRSALGAADLDELAETLPRMGARRYVLQTCRT
jgi:anaerobic ribonucleoside-triphosphate reductase activating protein